MTPAAERAFLYELLLFRLDALSAEWARELADLANEVDALTDGDYYADDGAVVTVR